MKSKAFINDYKLNFDENNNPSTFNMGLVIQDIPLSELKEWKEKLGKYVEIEMGDKK